MRSRLILRGAFRATPIPRNAPNNQEHPLTPACMIENASQIPPKERTARVSWAAHILYYLTKGRSHIEILQPDDVEEEEESEQSDLDAESERTAVLNGSRDSIRKKFLDCVAQLLSQSRGWENVTATALREREDFVEIDVARNDGFGILRSSWSGQNLHSFLSAEAEYCKALTRFLSTGNEQVPPKDFESVAIAYIGERVDFWSKKVRKLLTSALNSQGLGLDNRRSYERLQAIDIWTRFVSLLYAEPPDEPTHRVQLVYQTYECVASREIHDILCTSFEPNVVSKLRYALKFVARPLLDCQMLWHIANKYSQFREAHILPVSPNEKTNIDIEYQIGIVEAWARLKASRPYIPETRNISAFDKQFKADCATAYSLHAEIQLLMYYEDRPELTPSLPYFGCSKKACLLCEHLLGALPSHITTRGRHGICYPAWGIKPTNSARMEAALKSLETLLVSRIQALLSNSSRQCKNYFKPAVPQSTFVSDFSESTTQALLETAEQVNSARVKEDLRRKERLIREGAALASRSIDWSSRPDFEPYDACVMCNKSPAAQCKQCHSIWYCSKDCQKSDWSSHKLLCKKLSIQTPRPSLSYKRAIFFPVDRMKPEMIWLLSEQKRDDDELGTGALYEEIILHPYLGEDSPFIGKLYIEHNPIRGRNLGSGLVASAQHKDGYAVAVMYRDAYLKDGSAINMSISTAVATSGISPHKWCGPIVALRETPSGFFEDVMLADFRHIIDYLVSYGTTETRESVNHPEGQSSASIRGVKICCYGEERLHGSKPYVSVDVPRAHLTRLTSSSVCGVDVSPISKLLGLPLRLWRDPDVRPWIEPPGWDMNLGADSNQNAVFLMMETDIEEDGWGWARSHWNLDLGNVVAIRDDDKDLSIEDVEMMCYFARKKLQPLFEDALGLGLVQRTKQEVLDFITWENALRSFHEEVEHCGSEDAAS